MKENIFLRSMNEKSVFELEYDYFEKGEVVVIEDGRIVDVINAATPTI